MLGWQPRQRKPPTILAVFQKYRGVLELVSFVGAKKEAAKFWASCLTVLQAAVLAAVRVEDLEIWKAAAKLEEVRLKGVSPWLRTTSVHSKIRGVRFLKCDNPRTSKKRKRWEMRVGKLLLKESTLVDVLPDMNKERLGVFAAEDLPKNFTAPELKMVGYCASKPDGGHHTFKLAKGRYLLGATTIKECQRLGGGYASLVNSNLTRTFRTEHALPNNSFTSNCKIQTSSKSTHLVTTRKINAGDELFWPYNRAIK